jgi:hypothetical protein
LLDTVNVVVPAAVAVVVYPNLILSIAGKDNEVISVFAPDFAAPIFFLHWLRY